MRKISDVANTSARPNFCVLGWRWLVLRLSSWVHTRGRDSLYSCLVCSDPEVIEQDEEQEKNKNPVPPTIAKEVALVKGYGKGKMVHRTLVFFLVFGFLLCMLEWAILVQIPSLGFIQGSIYSLQMCPRTPMQPRIAQSGVNEGAGMQPRYPSRPPGYNFNCGSPDHYTTSCPLPRQGQGAPRILPCQNCQICTGIPLSSAKIRYKPDRYSNRCKSHLGNRRGSTTVIWPE